MKNYYDIKIPDNIDEFTLKAIEEGEKYKRKLTIRRKNIAIAASLALVILIGLGSTTLAKEYLSNVFSTVKEFVTLRDSSKKPIGINKTVTNNGVSITVQEAVYDDVELYVSFIVKSEKPFVNIKDNQLLIGEHSRVSFSNKPIYYEALKGKFVDEHTFVGINTYLLTDIDTDIPKNFSLDLDIKDVRLNGSEDGKEYIVFGDWKLSVPVEFDGRGIRVITPNINENDITIKKITLSNIHTKIEAQLPKGYSVGYSNKYVSIVTDKGVSVNQDSFTLKEKNDKVQLVSRFGGIPEDTKYIMPPR